MEQSRIKSWLFLFFLVSDTSALVFNISTSLSKVEVQNTASISPSSLESSSASYSSHKMSFSSDTKSQNQERTQSYVITPTLSWQSSSTRSMEYTFNQTTVLINTFIQNISQLDFKQADSLNKSIIMMEGLLTAMETTNSRSSLRDEDIFLSSKKLETFFLQYAEYHVDKGVGTISISGENYVLNARKIGPEDGDYTFRMTDLTNQETIKLSRENVKQDYLVVSMSFKRLGALISRYRYKIGDKRYNLQSKILSISVLKPNRKILIKNVTLKLSTPEVQPSNEYKKLCVFWDFSPRERKNQGWSSDGCTLVKSTDQYVECSCNHLTHFAVLMQVKDDQVPRDHDAVLTILTNIGLGLSIVGCILTFFAYWRFTDTESVQSQIRMNLVFVLAAAHILFLLGSAAKFHLILCISVAALLQLFYTSTLCWMFAEGIQLYMQVIKVFNTNLKMRQVYGFAWGLPLILIIVSLSIAGNGPGGLPSFVNDEFCWLSVENKLIWTFIAPVLLLILSNHVILVMVVKEINAINHNQNVTPEHTTMLRSSIRALVILAPLLGITWVVGLLCILGAGIVGLYIFTILNSFQGVFIFIFHCLRNSEMRY